MDSKTPQEVFELIKQIAMNNYTWGSPRSRAKPTRVHSVNMLTAMESRLAAIIEKKMGNLKIWYLLSLLVNKFYCVIFVMVNIPTISALI